MMESCSHTDTEWAQWALRLLTAQQRVQGLVRAGRRSGMVGNDSASGLHADSESECEPMDLQGPCALLCDSVRAAAGAVPVLGIARPAICRFAGPVSTVLPSVIVTLISESVSAAQKV